MVLINRQVLTIFVTYWNSNSRHCVVLRADYILGCMPTLIGLYIYM